MNTFKSSQYDAGSVLHCEFKSKGDPDQYGQIAYTFEFQGNLHEWKIKDEMRQQIFNGLRQGDKFRIVMKDTGKKFAYAEIKSDAAGDDVVNMAKEVFGGAAKSVGQQPTTHQSDDLQERIERAQMVNLAMDNTPDNASQADVIKIAEEYRTGPIGAYIREGAKEIELQMPEVERPKADDLPF